MFWCAFIYIFNIKQILKKGETRPGCSAHAEGCDGSTGTENKTLNKFLKNPFNFWKKMKI